MSWLMTGALVAFAISAVFLAIITVDSYRRRPRR